MANGQSALVPSTPVSLAAQTGVEHSTAMVQQMAQAQIQSAYVWAERHPRDWDVVEQRSMKECSRPEFVAIDPDPKKYGSSTAMYGVPRGGSYENGRWVPNIVTGFTIRFVEMVLPYVKNLEVECWPIGETEDQRIYRVVRIDYESNNREGEVIFVSKTVERRSVKDSDVVMGTRQNSDGKTVYIVRATNEEIETAKSARYSKVKRNLVLNVLPGWLKNNCEKQIRATQRNADAKDPDAARKSIFAAFDKIGVPVDELKAYLGHSGERLDPAELEELRLIYAAIAEGQATWKLVKQAKEDAGGEDVEAKVAGLFEKLEMTPAQQRPVKLKYVGQATKLIEYLEGLVAKQGTPAPKHETVAEKQAETVSQGATQGNPQPDGGTHGTGTQQVQQEEKPKATPPAKPAASKRPANNW